MRAQDLLAPRMLEGAARPFGYAASLFLAFMMLFTTVSVTLRYAEWAVFEGDVDLMVLALAGCIFIGLPYVMVRDDHVVVDMIDHIVPARVVTVLRWFGLLLTVGFITVSLVYSIGPAIEKLTSGETTMSLEISRFWMRLPILVGFAFAAAGGCLVIASWIVRGQPPATAHLA